MKCLGLDTESILSGAKLTDLHVHCAQQLLKQQFPHLNGLRPTVLQTKKSLGVRKPVPNQLQIIHSRGDHWTTVSNIGCRSGDVNVYDSVYKSTDKATGAVITNLFQSSAIEMVESQKQEGGTDCGLFAIATATALAYGHPAIRNEKSSSKLFQRGFYDIVSMLLVFLIDVNCKAVMIQCY